MELSFDIKGYLEPYEKIEITFEDFKKHFVDSFEMESSRQSIFTNYLDYLEAFNQAITPNYIQWIDGSFITNKENPNDIDFVTLIDFDIFEKNEQLIESTFRLKGAKTNFHGIDAYTLKVYPEDIKNIILLHLIKFIGITGLANRKKIGRKGNFQKAF